MSTRSLSFAKAIVAVGTLVVALAAPSMASAEFGFQPGSFRSDIVDSSGAVVPAPQAAAHPFAQQVSFQFNTKPAEVPASPGGGHPPSSPGPDPDGQVRTVITDLPPGFIGNTQAVPQCDADDFPPPFSLGPSQCPTATQVGVMELDLGLVSGFHTPDTVPVFNLVPPKNVVARLGFVNVAPTVIDIKVRTGGDYGVTATVSNITQAANIYGTKLTLWGVPADPRHDAQRYRQGQFQPGDAFGNPIPSNLPPTPFLTNISQCDVPVSTGIRIDSYQDPGNFLSYSSEPVLYSGCDRLTLKSSLEVSPTSAGAGEPTGISVELDVDQRQAPNTLGSPPIKKIAVTLPDGVSLSPSSADGLGVCTKEQIGLDNDADPSCPDASKVGSVQIDTPVLGEPLSGSVYLAKPGSGNNPFDSLIALYVVAKGNGVLVKLPGRVFLDPNTGRVTSVFDNNPQLPFSHLRVAFKGGARGALSQALTCGPKTTNAELTTWSGQTVNITGDYSVGAGGGSPSCGPQGFAPKMTAGSSSPRAGASTPFILRLTRSDADQQFKGVTTVLPEGLLGKLKGVAVCPAAQAAAGTCDSASQIGRVTVGAGPGSSPFYVDNGRVYLTAGYKGAPFGLSILTRAMAGPFDLGDVVVRGSLDIDPVTTRATVTTDPLPTILQGIPLQIRDTRVAIDRPGFMVNPTSCAEKTIEATVTSTLGATANLSSPFQVGDCAALDFEPKLAISLKGATHRSAHPKLKATLTMPRGGANIDRAAVTLPETEFLENAHIRTICTRVQYAAGEGGGANCPKESVYGFAKAWSPLLDTPIEGPVFLRSSNHRLPDLVASLDGQIHVDLSGRIDSPDKRIRNTFDFVPDAPVSKFVLTMQGGKKGLLVNNEELCKTKPRATALFDGQNGKASDSKPLVKIDCGKSPRKR